MQTMTAYVMFLVFFGLISLGLLAAISVSNRLGILKGFTRTVVISAFMVMGTLYAQLNFFVPEYRIALSGFFFTAAALTLITHLFEKQPEKALEPARKL